MIGLYLPHLTVVITVISCVMIVFSKSNRVVHIGFLGLLASVFIMVLAPQSHSHEWYPLACCNERDCMPEPVGGVTATKEGYLIVETGEVIPYEDAQVSPDGLFHRCKMLDDSTREISTGVCFWAPEVGS